MAEYRSVEINIISRYWITITTITRTPRWLINRLVYQDGAKYIIAQGTFESAWLSVTEQNKVIVMNANSDYRISNLPMYKYNFNASGQNVASNSDNRVVRKDLCSRGQETGPGLSG